jgi:hypothetical protein
MTRRRAPALALLLALPLGGCTAGPSYSGGPTEDDPHATLLSDDDMSVWRVDGWDTYTRTGEIYLEPGRRKLHVRMQYPVESEAQVPWEMKDLDVVAHDGEVLLLRRTGEGEHGPYGVDLRPKAAPRR